jgi:hypothetical protein
MDRRDFLKDAAQFLLVLPFGTFLVHCKDDKSSKDGANAGPDDTPPAMAPKVTGSNVIYTTSLTNDHSHSFTVPRAGFENAPLGGVVGLTTEGQGHQHRTAIDQEALRRAADGDIVKVETESAADHTHFFTIVKIG